MKIHVFEAEDWERDAFAPLQQEHELTFDPEPLTSDNADRHRAAEAVCTFVYSDLDQDVLAALPQLGLIATRSTGVDHIDLDACAARDITVCNVPDYGRNTVAEHAFALLLAISHRLPEAIDRTRSGRFDARGLAGFDLEGKTIGIVGTGGIGQVAARIARGFGMQVLAFDVAPDEQAAAELGFRFVGLDELLESSDIVTLHVPGNEKTRHLIGQAQLARIKRGAVLINTARGEVVDYRAMIQALAEGRLAAAGLDVLPHEPVVREEAELLRSIYEPGHDVETLLADTVLLNMRNVVVTPHSAFHTKEAVQRILDTTVENLRAFGAGRPRNEVTVAG